MTFDDFCKYFTDLSICRLVNTSWFSFNKTWSEVCFVGKWTAGPKNTETDRAGGCYNHRDTFLHNPQVCHTILSCFQSLKHSVILSTMHSITKCFRENFKGW